MEERTAHAAAHVKDHRRAGRLSLPYRFLDQAMDMARRPFGRSDAIPPELTVKRVASPAPSDKEEADRVAVIVSRDPVATGRSGSPHCRRDAGVPGEAPTSRGGRSS